VQFFDQVKYLGVWSHASLKDDDDIQRQVTSLYCAANKLRGTFDQYTPAVKNIPFRAYCMPIVEQIHTDQYEALTCCVQCLSHYASHTQKFHDGTKVEEHWSGVVTRVLRSSSNFCASAKGVRLK